VNLVIDKELGAPCGKGLGSGTNGTLYKNRQAVESLPPADVVRAEVLRRDLHEFVLAFWPVLEPGRRFVDGFHVRMICDHLQAVSEGMIKRLVVNIPPRFSKSTLVSVLWQAWDWLTHPDRRWLTSSHSYGLSVRDSRRMRLVIESPEYVNLIQRYQPGFSLAEDQNAKGHYENCYGGGRLACAVGSGIGEGGDILTVDDPHDASQYLSDTMREAATTWHDEVLSTRLNDPHESAIVVVMQRLHDRDYTGHLLVKEAGRWDHICLPLEYEGDDRVQSSLGACDPRMKAGELLCAERFGPDEVATMKRRPFTWAGQYQQRPVPRGGGLFRVEKIQVLREASLRGANMVRYWDKAGTPDGGCCTAGVLMLRRSEYPSFVVVDVVKGQWAAPDRERRIRQVAEVDGRNVLIWVEQEPGSGGLESAQNTVRGLAGWRVKMDRVTDSKDARADGLADQVAAGNVGVLNRAWTGDFLQELEHWPKGEFRDQGDAAAGAFNKLAKEPSGVLVLP
jgi:predicted phage terminase large subunit-like protein